ncbi:MAG: protein kinase [Steroidobacteraceae bacterium]|jgi:serine/threonine protein kinase|nr:protein kinase [Steroidobacteraceae bacterium]
MSVTFFRSPPFSAQRRGGWPGDTQDLDPTADFNEENTSDLNAPQPPPTLDLGESPDDSPGDRRSAMVGGRTMDLEHSRVDTHEVQDTPGEPAPEPPHAASCGTLDPARASEVSPGVLLKERYLVEELIGAGGVALVYRARDMRAAASGGAAAHVALKTPRPESHDYTRARRRLTHEYEHTKALSHPNIVRVLELNTVDEPCFMTMELLQGKLLTELMHEGKTVCASFAHRILHGCARALTHAHSRNVVHGDFKPGNVFITREDVVKVIDFGAAATPRGAQSRIAAGTPTYASPEVLSGETPEVRDDVFSLACVAYELLTAEHPFARRSSLQAREENISPPRARSLSDSQWLTLLAALSWKREQRPASIEAFMTGLALEAARPAAAIEQARHDPQLPEELTPQPRSWGFFVFIACAVAVTWLAGQRQTEREAQLATTPPSAVMNAGEPLSQAPLGRMPPSSFTPAASRAAPRATSLAAASVPDISADSTAPPPPAPPTRQPASALSEISFETSEIVTSGRSIAAVFLVKRSPPLSGRAAAQWRTISGSAQAGDDVEPNAAGTVEFADGQAQRAIYVPLHNDLLQESTETFRIELHSPRNARIGSLASAAARILKGEADSG